MTVRLARAFGGAFAAVVWLATAGGCTGPTEGPARGAAVYATCQPCHGADGEGNRVVEAPPIAALPGWYIEAQLRKFREGARGDHPADSAGLKMRAMARTLSSETDLMAMVGYVSSMPATKPVAVLTEGDAARGKTLFAVCAACHGLDGAGNEALKAPPIRAAADWYLVAQIQKFRAGIRGADPLDLTGQQMAPMAKTLPDEQAVYDVVAHIVTLAR